MAERPAKRLFRSPADKMIAGVCGGVAEYVGVDSTIVRILWLLSLFAGGLGFWMYLAAWAIVPERPAAAEERVQARGSVGLFVGIFLILVGFALLSRNWHFWGFYYPYWHYWDVRAPFEWWFENARNWLPWMIIVAGIAYIVYLLTTGSGKPTGAEAAPPQGETSAAGAEMLEATPSTRQSKKLYRIREGRMIAGVCNGLAEYFGIDVSLVRLLWILGTLLTSVVLGVLVYLVTAIVVPERPTKVGEVAA